MGLHSSTARGSQYPHGLARLGRMGVAAVQRAAWAANGGATVANFLELYKRACCQATPAGFRILRERLAFKGRRRRHHCRRRHGPISIVSAAEYSATVWGKQVLRHQGQKTGLPA